MIKKRILSLLMLNLSLSYAAEQSAIETVIIKKTVCVACQFVIGTTPQETHKKEKFHQSKVSEIKDDKPLFLEIEIKEPRKLNDTHCQYCDKQYANSGSFSKHQQKCLNFIKIKTCSRCEAVLPSIDSFIRHKLFELDCAQAKTSNSLDLEHQTPCEPNPKDFFDFTTPGPIDPLSQQDPNKRKRKRKSEKKDYSSHCLPRPILPTDQVDHSLNPLDLDPALLSCKSPYSSELSFTEKLSTEPQEIDPRFIILINSIDE
jgi:hypothetical protein